MPSNPTKEFFLNRYGSRIHGCYFEPNVPKGVVILVHGLGEHSGRYFERVVPMLVDCGLAVVAYDNIGHGLSSGKRGHCPGYVALLDILGEVIHQAESFFQEQPLFLYGHSMGGNLVLNYALRRNHQIKGIIATSPYLRLAFEPPKWKMGFGRMLLHVYPSLTMGSGLDPNGISRIPKEVEKYGSDPLVHDKVSPMFSFPIMDAGQWAIEHASDLTVDALLLHGSGDPIIDYRGTEEFHRNSRNTELQLFEGAYHELHYDLCAKEMLQTIQNWFRQRLRQY
ncbi:MAG: lysophospholipase [Aurantibacter sp.]